MTDTPNPTLYVTPMPHDKYEITSKGQGTLLYMTKEELETLISWNDYVIVYVEEK